MCFKPTTIKEDNVIVCVLRKVRVGKAIPKSVQIDSHYEVYESIMNYLNELNLPGAPASYWISKGYQVYSSLTDDGFWFQYCINDIDLSEKMEDVAKYKELFIQDIEPPMCTEKGCYAYMTFDLCPHTVPEEEHYILYDYNI